MVNSSSSLVSVIHGLGYVLAKQQSNYVFKMNMGIKQNPTPSVPLKPN
jgi:hypothetical protein